MELTREGLEAQELLKAQAHVWNHIYSYTGSMSLRCAVELGIPDIIHNHGRPMTLSELVDALPVPPARASHLRRLMRLLVHLGFFALHKKDDHDHEEEGYLITAPSKLLLSESTMNLLPHLLTTLDPVLLSQWHLLSRWFQGEEGSVMETATGLDIWEYMVQHPETGNEFNETMANDSRMLMDVLVNECGWVFKGVAGSLVDVGGGTGQSALRIAQAFPHIKCTVLDRPNVVATAPKAVGLDFIGGDMFESIPKADAVFLKWILHDWGDEDCVKILKRCKEAISSKEKGGGKVIIVDMVVDTKQAGPKLAETQLFFDVSMMVHIGGKEREEQEWHKIFIDAGFNQYKITPVLGLRAVIELYP